MKFKEKQTSTGGREATEGVIAGRFALSVGRPNLPEPKGWKWTKLTDVARLETGHTPSRRHPEYWDGDVPWIGIKDATGNHGRIINDTIQHVTQDGIDNSSARILPANTVCLSRTASVGYVVIMGKPMATSQDFINWVCSDAIDYRYLAAVLFAENSSYSLFSHGTTHQTIYFPEAKAFHILLPPINLQTKIANVIWSINQKIELNRQINQTLEQMAQDIFKSWFVDFDPVRAKMEGRDTGLPKHIADLFPDELVESELGLVPKGWEIKKLEEMTSYLNRGISPKYVEDGGVLVLNQKCVRDGMVDISKGRRHDIAQRKIDGRELIIGDMLVNSTGVGTLGRVAQVLDLEETTIVDSHVTVIRPNKSYGWCFFGIMLMRAQSDIEAMGEGSTGQTELSRSKLAGMKFIAPSIALVDVFDNEVLPMRKTISNNQKECAILATIRDGLLSKLLSGEIEVGNSV
jgi:type I restriction enzyme S subunit